MVVSQSHWTKDNGYPENCTTLMMIDPLYLSANYYGGTDASNSYFSVPEALKGYVDGRLAALDSNIQSRIRQTTVKAAYGPGGTSNQTGSVMLFPPSFAELFGYGVTSKTDGMIFDAFSNDESRAFNFIYWTRSCSSEFEMRKFAVNSAGASGSITRADTTPRNVLYCFNIINDTPVTDAPVAGVYDFYFNTPPTAPGTINVPATIYGGQNTTISWATSSDPDGNLAGYRLERSVNGGGWDQVYQGVAASFSDAVTFGWNTVAYRVKAYDTSGAESVYTTGPTRTIINNTPPVISGSDGSMGEKSSGFTQSYTVSDAQGGTVSVTERLNGNTIRVYNVTLDASNQFQVTGERFQTLLNGTHTMTVTATDNMGASAVRTWKFIKKVNSLSIVKTQPFPVSEMPAVCIVNVTRMIPPGASFKVEACNNGNDASPTWEDMTSAVLAARKYYFSNTAKTASTWAFNVRVTASRGTAVGDLYISGIGGNFE
jgi:hypothetical protein